jgi:UDP-N-acetyl-D-mannosaminuronic acid dehydrogenase
MLIFNKSKNCNFELAFCPERTLEGDALNELQSLPQIIGADSEQSAERAIKFFSK